VYSEVIVFACNWDGWSCIESATRMGLNYPVSVKVVRVSCLSRVHVGLILKAFELGASGVMLLGCEQGKCHFGIDGKYITSEYEKARHILGILGIQEGRLVLAQLPAFDGLEFVTQVKKLIEEISQVPLYKHNKVVSSKLTQSNKVESYP